MSKEIKAKIRMQIPAGAATPAPPVGVALGQQGVNIMEFCKQFNARTAAMKGQTIPVVVTVYIDKKFDFITKMPPVTDLIKKKINLASGSSNPSTAKVATMTWRDIEEIAKVKMSDLNANDIEQAKKIIAGSARSMGIDVV